MNPIGPSQLAEHFIAFAVVYQVANVEHKGNLPSLA